MQETLDSRDESSKDSIEFLFRHSLKQLQASGTPAIAAQMSKILYKRTQRAPNCQTVGAKAAFAPNE